MRRNGSCGRRAHRLTPTVTVGLAPVAVVLRAVFGLSYLIAPKLVTRLATNGSVSRSEILLVRVLGIRQLGQAMLIAINPNSTTMRRCVEVDGIHGITMVVLGGASRRWRRGASFEALSATMFCLDGLVRIRAMRSSEGRDGRSRSGAEVTTVSR